MDIVLILTVALIIEFTVGDPPNRFHPVAWMGKAINLLEKAAFGGGPRYQLVYGAVVTMLLAVAVGLFAFVIGEWLESINYWLYIVIFGLLLKSSFCFFFLRKTAMGIKKQLDSGDIESARLDLRGLVSRDTSQLPQPLLVSATAESVSESLCDSVVSPLFYFLILGVPGALAFRVVSTFDSMVGYHGKYEYFGKFPARLDDVLNYIPARISAGLIILGSRFSGMSSEKAWKIARRDHGKTDSPNAGWPMAAAAGALQVRLEKTGQYLLGDPVRPLATGIVDDSLRLINWATWIWFLACYAVGGALIAFG
ncbi:cobalamin biosynthesis protein CobD [Dehalogenimonas lykanthroporepellens BL-DC-9]|nr:cobalamin biosynthesis protein CobD [Dehalogenimonas lykanthroporepellens BL-DC-9]